MKELDKKLAINRQKRKEDLKKYEALSEAKEKLDLEVVILREESIELHKQVFSLKNDYEELKETSDHEINILSMVQEDLTGHLLRQDKNHQSKILVHKDTMALRHIDLQ